MSEHLAEPGSSSRERAVARERGLAVAGGDPQACRPRARNLQTAPGLGREPERAVERSYDFRCSRLRLLEQVAAKLGIESAPLNRYNRAPTKACRRIGEECDLKPGLVKIAVEAQLRCARNRISLGKTLAPGPTCSDRAVGELRALRLLRSAEFGHLSREAWHVVSAILHCWPKREEGILIDESGHEIPAAASRYAKLAQLLDGAETAMLQTLSAELGVDAEDVRRGGLILATPLNRRRLTRLVHARTGYRLSIKMKRLRALWHS